MAGSFFFFFCCYFFFLVPIYFFFPSLANSTLPGFDEPTLVERKNGVLCVLHKERSQGQTKQYPAELPRGPQGAHGNQLAAIEHVSPEKLKLPRQSVSSAPGSGVSGIRETLYLYMT